MYMSMLPQGSHINKGLATVFIAAGRGSLWMVRPCTTAPLDLAFVAAFLQVPVDILFELIQNICSLSAEVDIHYPRKKIHIQYVVWKRVKQQYM